MKPDPDQVYPVREDSLLLLEVALDEVRPSDRVLDLGTGSGYIARHLVGKAALIIATDVNPHACRIASYEGVGVARSDLTAGLQGHFDLMLFNPPYLPTKPGERIADWLEKALDGGENGRDVIGRLLPDLPRVLAPGGRLLLIISEVTGVEEVLGLLRDAGFDVEIVRRNRVEGEDLLVMKAKRSQGQP
ncbi:MAG: methyltransferase [Methanomicrobiales archaeon]|nr:methyltransferase [Methanomicrobiales archaeon]MDD1663059.1 methyltransferase [Methanomicrobiales archaeon]